MEHRNDRYGARAWLGLSAMALAAGSAVPAAADDHRDHGGIGAGEIIAGAVVLGGIAALAGAFDGDGDRWDRGGGWDRSGWNRGGWGNPRTAVDRCVRAAENQARRFGGWRFADVIDVRDVDRTRDGFRVRGRIEVQGSPRWNGPDFDRGRFTCRFDGRGPLVDFDGIRGLR